MADTKIVRNTERRRPPRAGKGRPKGAKNRTTAEVREAVALIAERNVEDFEAWLHAIKDPARRCEVYLKVLGYHLPRLEAVTASVTTHKTIDEMTDDELRALLGDPPPAQPDDGAPGEPLPTVRNSDPL